MLHSQKKIYIYKIISKIITNKNNKSYYSEKANCSVITRTLPPDYDNEIFTNHYSCVYCVQRQCMCISVCVHDCDIQQSTWNKT